MLESAAASVSPAFGGGVAPGGFSVVSESHAATPEQATSMARATVGREYCMFLSASQRLSLRRAQLSTVVGNVDVRPKERVGPQADRANYCYIHAGSST